MPYYRVAYDLTSGYWSEPYTATLKLASGRTVVVMVRTAVMRDVRYVQTRITSDSFESTWVNANFSSITWLPSATEPPILFDGDADHYYHALRHLLTKMGHLPTLESL